MRQVNASEREKLLPMIVDRDAAQAALEDAELALGRAVASVRRDCMAPSDAMLDPYSFEWVKHEQTAQGGMRRVALKADG